MMNDEPKGITELDGLALAIRNLSVRAIYQAKSGHPGGCLSVADILSAILFRVIQPQPYMPMAPDGDVLILSKGHSAPALYAAHHLLGLMTHEELMSLRRFNEKAQGHPARTWTSGVATSTGSLGHGVAFAVGLALAFKRKNADRHVYCVVGDGDIQEGMTTEAMRLASHWRLSNLVVVCDRNMKTSDRHSIEPHRNSVDEVKALGWWTEWCDGHDIKQIVKILEFGREKTSRPFYLEACTTKGKGVSFMERDPDGYHGSLTLSTDEAVEALAELGDAEKLEVNR